MKNNQYEAYVNIDIPWIGKLPSHWDIWKLATRFPVIGSGTTPKSGSTEFYEDGRVPWLNTGDLNDSELNGCEKSLSQLAMDAHSALKLYRHPSVVIALYGATIGKVAKLNFDTTVNQACCVISGKSEEELKHLFYSLLAAREHILSLSLGGGQPNISQDAVRSLRVPIPPLDEISTIVNFLDRETARIDELIQRQQRLIELLSEKRKSVISNFLLRGINENEELVDSGSEILGLIPKRWKKKRLKYFLSLSPSYKENAAVDVSTPTPFFAMESIGEDGSLNGEIERPFGDVCNSYTYFRNNDVVVSKVTPCFENGKGALINGLEIGFGFGTTELAVLRPMETLDSEYLYYITISREIREFGTAFMTGAGGLKRVPDDFYLNLVWPLPPIKEQLEIIQKLKEILCKIDILIKKSNDSVEYLKEHRASLISAAVTGKIDVRNIQ